MITTTETATFGAGCFWGIEAAFRRLPGVLRSSVGFMGGRTQNPTYEQVCIGNTGHAEVVQVVFDPAQISYENLLDTFWAVHDPTTWVKSNPDTKSQYRSVIFYHSKDQETAAVESKIQNQPRNHNAISTEVLPAGSYTLADRSHQQYEEKQARHLSSGANR